MQSFSVRVSKGFGIHEDSVYGLYLGSRRVWI